MKPSEKIRGLFENQIVKNPDIVTLMPESIQYLLDYLDEEYKNKLDRQEINVQV